jgi:ATP-dependent Clp protease ATP-binding subunit ClpA
MTTNAGASDMARESLGFGQLTREGEDEEAVKKMFTPEFRNRLDAVVPFGYLPTEVINRVVEKFILQLELQLADRHVHIALDEEAKAWLTERGYDKLYGRPPMARLIQEKVKQPLAEELLFGQLVHGGEVKVHVKDGRSASRSPAPPPASPARAARPRSKPRSDDHAPLPSREGSGSLPVMHPKPIRSALLADVPARLLRREGGVSEGIYAGPERRPRLGR